MTSSRSTRQRKTSLSRMWSALWASSWSGWRRSRRGTPMARYDRVYANLAERAVLQGGIDAEAFIRQALDAGISPARLVELIQDDMLEDGPVFGKFLRSIVGAVEASAMAAQGQGVTVGTIDGDDELRRLVGLANTADVLGAGSG